MYGILTGKNSESIKLLLDLAVANLQVCVEVWDSVIDFNTQDEWRQAWCNIESGKAAGDIVDDIAQYLIRDGKIVSNYENDGAICLLRDAIGALLNYDCADMLDCNIDEVALLARLGDTAAVLIYPACVAIHDIKEQDV